MWDSTTSSLHRTELCGGSCLGASAAFLPDTSPPFRRERRCVAVTMGAHRPTQPSPCGSRGPAGARRASSGQLGGFLWPAALACALVAAVCTGTCEAQCRYRNENCPLWAKARHVNDEWNNPSDGPSKFGHQRPAYAHAPSHTRARHQEKRKARQGVPEGEVVCQCAGEGSGERGGLPGGER